MKQASSTTTLTETSFKTSSTENIKFSSLKADDSNTTVATDFKEDPFKNYRYEDPFLIEDPFNDENGNQKPKEIGNLKCLKFIIQFLIFFTSSENSSGGEV